MDSPLLEELDAITEGKSKLDLAEEIWRLRRAQPEAARTDRPFRFVEAVLNIALKRQKGYVERRHGDILNKECMDEVVALCRDYTTESLRQSLPPLPQEEGP